MTTKEMGSRVVTVGPIAIACMAPTSREALDLAMERWARHLEGRADNPPKDSVYSFAYWLFRWSGIVTGVNLDAPENPFEGPLARALRENAEEREKSEAANADYTGEPCQVCGRIRVYLRKDGKHQCEKCEAIQEMVSGDHD